MVWRVWNAWTRVWSAVSAAVPGGAGLVAERRGGLLDRLHLGLDRLAELLGALLGRGDWVWSWVCAARQAVHSLKIRSVSTTTIDRAGGRAAPGGARNGERERGKSHAESEFVH